MINASSNCNRISSVTEYSERQLKNLVNLWLNSYRGGIIIYACIRMYL